MYPTHYTRSDAVERVSGNRSNGTLALPKVIPHSMEELETRLVAQMPSDPVQSSFGD